MYDVGTDPEKVRGFIVNRAVALKRNRPVDVLLDDLIQDGNIGMIAAAAKYDPTRGATFTTFASRRIDGAMIDGLRRYDPVPRLTRCREKLGLLKAPETKRLRDVVESKRVDPCLIADGAYAAVDDRDAFESIIRKLQCRKAKLMFRLYFIADLTMREVGRALGCSESQVSKTIADSLKILRATQSSARHVV